MNSDDMREVQKSPTYMSKKAIFTMRINVDDR